MQFKPILESEVDTFNLLNPGVYDFVVNGAKEKISHAGNEMIELRLTIYDESGKENIVYDYLLQSSSSKLKFKLRHFCEIVGLLDKYELGSITAEDCMLKSGRVEIEIQEGQYKPDGSKYNNKNVVKDYVKKSFEKSKIELVSKVNSTASQEFIDDNIPF